MSFSQTTKAEICRQALTRRSGAQAEAYGTLLYGNLFSPEGVRIVTESDALSRRLPVLFRKAFQLAFDVTPSENAEGKRVFAITDREKIGLIFRTFGAEPEQTLAHSINFGVLEEAHCRTAFLRGAFLAGGSVTDPRKRYHLELATAHYNVGRSILPLFAEAGFYPRNVTRKANYVTYFKQSQSIEEFLTLIGAPLAAMEIMNAQAERNLLGSINRKVNCDAANLDKTVDAAQAQIEAIRKLQQRAQISSLPEKLRQTAELRLENPELALSQLAELCDPPVTKSALNHRLRKLVDMARDKPAT